MQTMHIQYSAAPQHTRKVYGVSRYHGGNNNFCGRVVHGDQRRVNCKCGHGSWINSDFTHYCWNCVMFAHTGTDCRTPEEGHKKEAVRRNNISGSERNCT